MIPNVRTLPDIGDELERLQVRRIYGSFGARGWEVRLQYVHPAHRHLVESCGTGATLAEAYAAAVERLTETLGVNE